MANEYKPVTAQDAIAPFGALSTDAENVKTAEEAGVVDAAYVDYEKALKNYEARSDIETLEQRLARENGRTFEEAKENRAVTESAYVEGDNLAEVRENLGENRDFKAAQASKTGEVSDGREVASLEDVAKDQADKK